jgi:hypothetical protein
MLISQQLSYVGKPKCPTGLGGILKCYEPPAVRQGLVA